MIENLEEIITMAVEDLMKVADLIIIRYKIRIIIMVKIEEKTVREVDLMVIEVVLEVHLEILIETGDMEEIILLEIIQEEIILVEIMQEILIKIM
jgi:hypothetical protein